MQPDSVTCSFRDVADADHEWLVALHNDPLVLYNTKNPNPITIEHHMRWWSGIKDNPREMRFVFTVDGERAGFMKVYDIDTHNHSCVLGADLEKSFRGRGLAKPMWTLLLSYCFDMRGLHRVGLSTMTYNLPGVKTYLGMGFRLEGTMKDYQFRDGRYHDALCMHMLKDDWDARKKVLET